MRTPQTGGRPVAISRQFLFERGRSLPSSPTHTQILKVGLLSAPKQLQKSAQTICIQRMHLQSEPADPEAERAPPPPPPPRAPLPPPAGTTVWILPLSLHFWLSPLGGGVTPHSPEALAASRPAWCRPESTQALSFQLLPCLEAVSGLWLLGPWTVTSVDVSPVALGTDPGAGRQARPWADGRAWGDPGVSRSCTHLERVWEPPLTVRISLPPLVGGVGSPPRPWRCWVGASRHRSRCGSAAGFLEGLTDMGGLSVPEPRRRPPREGRPLPWSSVGCPPG